MEEGTPLDRVPPALRDAFVERGFESLTAVQEAVLEPALRGRDLRISSQTGSGKTVAIGLAIFDLLGEAVAAEEGVAAPRTIVITPTRELAAQVQKELAWLFRPVSARVAVVTGGTSFGVEARTLRRGAEIVVGTPGRLLDHLSSGTIDARHVGALVLDEADQMLDLGFRDDLDAILAKMPERRRTHLVSATFSREVLELAARFQTDPASVEGTALGAPNVDIAHVVHPIVASERDDVLVNLLLLAPGESTLVFVRTREATATLATKLADAGFSAAPLSGEMEQRERTRTLDAFRRGAISVLVATDVAARGLDVPDVARVVHADLPGDPDVYTHRSGRTGRAGKKGTSVLLVPARAKEIALRILRRAGVAHTVVAAPSYEDVVRAADERLVAEIAEPVSDEDGRLSATAYTLLERHEAADVVVALLARVVGTRPKPRRLTAIEVSDESRRERAPRPMPRAQTRGPTFRVTWGSEHGADPRRLTALLCRRGAIRGSDIGAIDVGPRYSRVEISPDVAEAFARAASRPDAREPWIRIEPWSDSPHPKKTPAWKKPRAKR